jgi:hypothetical protein
VILATLIGGFVTSVATAQTVTSLAAFPTTVPVAVGTPVRVTAGITDASLVPGSVLLQRIDTAGRVVGTLGTMVDDGTNGDVTAGDKVFTLRATLYEQAAGAVKLRASAAFAGKLTRVLSSPVTVTVTGVSATVSITQPPNLAYLSVSPIQVRGVAGSPSAKVVINGVPAAVAADATFTAQVPLQEGANTLAAVATNLNGAVTTATVQVTLDTTPPKVNIDTPEADFTTSAATISVGGLVNDIVVGTVNNQQATVKVNGIVTQVSNRSFLAASVPLVMGLNNIQAVATDRSGNSATASVQVTRVPVTGGAIDVLSGNNQTGPVGNVLPNPLVVKLTNAAGQPAANQAVVFRVVENSGGLVSGSGRLGAVAVNTDAQGRASVQLQLGQRSGVGNNRVEAEATGFHGTAVFLESGTASAAKQIVVDTGNSQVGVIGQALPLPFIAIVTDAGFNRLANVPVTFTVKQGGGTIGGKPSIVTNTDSDGRVAVVLTLGNQEGYDNNVVEATFSGNPGQAAAFLASGKVPGDANLTSIEGVVLDNANQPIVGATMRLFRTHHGTGVAEQVVEPVVTDAKGVFKIKPAPVGSFKLMADGSTGANGPWPTLEFDMVTVAGQINDVGLPIFLPRLDSSNALCVSESTGGTLTLPQVPGFALKIQPGAATFPGGARSGCVTVTPVNADKVPMSPGFGQQPRFVVTIQPVGTIFNPPAELTLPNVDGLAPRAVTEMYSYDHDLAAFVSIGTGTVSDDGSVITSDPGVGVIKAGWHCGGNPNAVGSAGTCKECQKCQGTECVADPAQNGKILEENKCQQCKGGAPEDIPLSDTEKTISYTFGVPNETVKEINDLLGELKSVGVIASLEVLSLTGELKSKECCEPKTGKGEETTGSVKGTLIKVEVKGKLWPPGPIPSKEIEIDFGFGEITIQGEFVGGIFLNGAGSIEGTVGYRKRTCADDPADKAGCLFAEMSANLTPSISAEIGGSGSLEYSCIFCEGAKYTVSARAAAEVAWPWKIATVSYNLSKCSDGLKAGAFEPQPVAFDIFVEFSGSYEPADGPSEKITYNLKLLHCQLPGDNGDYCQFVF